MVGICENWIKKDVASSGAHISVGFDKGASVFAKQSSRTGKWRLIGIMVVDLGTLGFMILIYCLDVLVAVSLMLCLLCQSLFTIVFLSTLT